MKLFLKIILIPVCLAVFLVPPLLSAPAKLSGLPEVIKAAQPSVVNVKVETDYYLRQRPRPWSFLSRFFRDFFEFNDLFGKRHRAVRYSGVASGVIVDPSGLVITNAHCVKESDRISVITVDHKEHWAVLVGRDMKQDLALLKIQGGGVFDAIPFGDPDKANVGDDVVAIGTPYGFSQTVTRGIISGLNREVSLYGDFVLRDMIQTDVSANPGNSGGPLLNMQGELLGIVTLGRVGGNAMNFAISSNRIKEAIEELQSDKSETELLRKFSGKFAFIPAQGRGTDGRKVIEVSDISFSSSAFEAGLRKGDIIRVFYKFRAEGLPEFIEKSLEIPAGERVYVEFKRQGRVYFTYLMVKL